MTYPVVTNKPDNSILDILFECAFDDTPVQPNSVADVWRTTFTELDFDDYTKMFYGGCQCFALLKEGHTLGSVIFNLPELEAWGEMDGGNSPLTYYSNYLLPLDANGKIMQGYMLTVSLVAFETFLQYKLGMIEDYKQGFKDLMVGYEVQ